MGTEPPKDGDEPGPGVAWGQSPAGGGQGGDTWGWGQGWILVPVLPPHPTGKSSPPNGSRRTARGSRGGTDRVAPQNPWVKPPRPCPHPGANGDPGAIPMRPAGCAPPSPMGTSPKGAGLSHGPVCHRELGARPRYPLCVPPPSVPQSWLLQPRAPRGRARHFLPATASVHHGHHRARGCDGFWGHGDRARHRGHAPRLSHGHGVPEAARSPVPYPGTPWRR